MATPKLRFKEFDGDWTSKQLGKIIGVSSASRVFKEQWQDSGVPFFRTSDVVSIFKNKENEKAYISLELFEELAKKSGKIKQGDLLVTGGGTIGIPYLVPNDQPLYFKDADLLWMKSSGIVEGSFLYNFFISPKFREYLKSISHTGTISHFTIEQAKATPFGFPSKEEQTKIASFLSAVDEKISQLTQKHELLSQYKQGMMQKLFSQQLRFKADDGSEFGEWEEIKLTDFLKFTPRPIEKPNTNYHALGVRSHFKGLFNKFDSEPNKISMDTLYRVKRNDVVVNITFAWEGAMAIAEKEHDEGLVSHRFPTYLCDDSKINLHFFKYRFIQKDFLSALQLCSPGGAGRNRVLNKSAFLEISFSKPTLEEQTKIANFLSSIDQKIEIVAQQIEQAKTWKKGLLQQMFV
ncbi:restriction endonuclease subunit S [Acinetobacter radioresistens]|uniref:restriction endonuclease subunit S n=1 Tax=Acinetobacter radioresistens TaxID=40216 RepID=UPI003263D993